jgi:hypothetical protein
MLKITRTAITLTQNGLNEETNFWAKFITHAKVHAKGKIHRLNYR